ncbi:MAG: hypothetical protein ACI89X_000110 [Planctomycetota bacterium]
MRNVTPGHLESQGQCGCTSPRQAYLARVFRCTTFHIVCLTALLASSCQSPPKPLTLPPATLSVDYERSVLARPEGPPLAARLMELYAVSKAPGGTPIALAAAAIVSDRGTPFRGKTQLPTGSRWLAPTEVLAWRSGLAQRQPWQLQELGTVTAVLAHQLVTSVSIDSVGALPTFQLQRGVSGLRATLSTEASADRDHEGSDPDMRVEREVVVIADAIDSAEPVGLFVPDVRVPGGGLLLLAMPSAAPSPETLAAATERANSKLAIAADANPLPMAWRVAKKAIGARNRRPALLAVVTPLQLPRIADLILASDEPLLIAMTEQLGLVDGTVDNVGWPVEAAMWQALIPRMERDELTPSLQAAATRHLGAIYDDASTLQLLLKMSGDGESFARGLLEENLAALGDRSAAIRVTAVTWLHGKKVAVDDYDAMGSKADRRGAVRRYVAAQEAARAAAEHSATEAGR